MYIGRGPIHERDGSDNNSASARASPRIPNLDNDCLPLKRPKIEPADTDPEEPRQVSQVHSQPKNNPNIPSHVIINLEDWSPAVTRNRITAGYRLPSLLTTHAQYGYCICLFIFRVLTASHFERSADVPLWRFSGNCLCMFDYMVMLRLFCLRLRWQELIFTETLPRGQIILVVYIIIPKNFNVFQWLTDYLPRTICEARFLLSCLLPSFQRS